jgi:hypothetical protein
MCIVCAAVTCGRHLVVVSTELSMTADGTRLKGVAESASIELYTVPQNGIS